MTQEKFYLYVTGLSVLIFVLSIGVGYFYIKLQKVKRQQIKAAEKYLQKEQERQAFVKDSLRTIGKAYIAEQCDASEACIRLRMLIDRVDFVQNIDFPIIFKMYDEIKHFKTHEARQALSKKDLNVEDRQRFAIEKKYRDNLRNECELLLQKLESH